MQGAFQKAILIVWSPFGTNAKTLLVVFVVIEKGPIVLVRLVIDERFARAALHDDARDQTYDQTDSHQASDAGVGVEEKIVQRTEIHGYLVTLTRDITIATECLQFSVRVYYVEPIRYGSAWIFLYSLRALKKGKHQHAMGKDKRKRKRRITASIAIVAIVAAIVSAVLGLTSFIDKKLNQSAEQQVVTFTEQSASNVTCLLYTSRCV